MGGGLYFWFMKDAVYALLKQGGYLKAIREDRIFDASVDPIAKLYPRLDPQFCRACKARIFPQCRIALPNGEPRTD
jgi:SulP family sulfate permease